MRLVWLAIGFVLVASLIVFWRSIALGAWAVWMLLNLYVRTMLNGG